MSTFSTLSPLNIYSQLLLLAQSSQKSVQSLNFLQYFSHYASFLLNFLLVSRYQSVAAPTLHSQHTRHHHQYQFRPHKLKMSMMIVSSWFCLMLNPSQAIKRRYASKGVCSIRTHSKASKEVVKHGNYGQWLMPHSSLGSVTLTHKFPLRNHLLKFIFFISS